MAKEKWEVGDLAILHDVMIEIVQLGEDCGMGIYLHSQGGLFKIKNLSELRRPTKEELENLDEKIKEYETEMEIDEEIVEQLEQLGIKPGDPEWAPKFVELYKLRMGEK